MIPTERARSAARTWAESAAPAPVRSEVIEAQSTIASSSPVSALESSSAPATTGRPRSGLPGNEVTHLSTAKPSPLAGMARKSPFGGASR